MTQDKQPQQVQQQSPQPNVFAPTARTHGTDGSSIAAPRATFTRGEGAGSPPRHDQSQLATRQPRRMLANIDEMTLARGLGWFSIGLGLTELLMPRQLARAIGVDERTSILPLFGLREIASGIAILASSEPTNAVRSRVVGDAMDLAFLGSALPTQNRADRGKVLAAGAAVASVTALDVLCSVLLQQRHAALASGDRTQRGEVELVRGVTLQQTPDELYRFWRAPENLPRVMSHLKSVTAGEGGRTHWTADFGMEWDAELSTDVPNRHLAWRSLTSAEVSNEVSVEFEALPANRGTRLTLSIRFKPANGSVPAAFSKLLRGVTGEGLQQDLRRFKQLMETGEVATTQGQSTGRRSAISRMLP